MYPNQQPPQNQQGYGPQPPQPQQPNYPQAPGYGSQPQPTYAVDYLDQIAPPAPRQSFLSGSFGKIVIILGVIFVLAVSLIIALGGQKKTATTEAMVTKLENVSRVVKETHKNIKSNNLSSTNSNFQIWLTNTERETTNLLDQAGVKKTSYDKKMVAAQRQLRTDLTDKFDDARLNGKLDRVYATEMAYQTELMINELTVIAKKTPGKAFDDYSGEAIKNLTPIHDAFADFDESKD